MAKRSWDVRQSHAPTLAFRVAPSNVSPAETEADLAIVRELVREYVAQLPFPLTFQDLERELAQIEVEYGPPRGLAWIGWDQDQPAGCAGIRQFSDEAAELKRMYVRPAYRGTGMGTALATASIAGARSLGYRQILLDTVATMTAAIGIYERLGFSTIEPYRYNPRPDAVFMRLDL